MMTLARRINVGALLVMMCASSFFCESVGATVLRDLSLADLTAEADVIVIATIGKARAIRDPKGQIWTDTFVDVEETVKGKRGQASLLIRQQGGQLGDEVSRIDGNARLAEGERKLLFLKERAGLFYTVGMELGSFEVYTDSANQRRVRRASTVPVARTLTGTQGAGMKLGHASELYNDVELKKILGDVRRLLRKGSAGGER